MSKIIKMTPEYLEQCRSDFERALSGLKMTDGKLSFTKSFDIPNRKAKILFTPQAWTKMIMLVQSFEKEVAWHGVAHRSENENDDEYIISDIVVYPQTVSGATVEMDTEEYANWLMENSDDERFNNLRMQGHSHVRMATTPSSVDLNHQQEILELVPEDDFYIFMIWNKSLSSNNRIYDLKKNVYFEDKDISVDILFGESLSEFIQESTALVKERAPANKKEYPQSQYTPNGNPYNPNSGFYTSTPKNASSSKSNQKSLDDRERVRVGAGWYDRYEQLGWG